MGVMQGRVRLARGAAAGVLSTVLALLFHLAAGGPVPGLLGVVAPLVLSVLVAVHLSGRRLSPARLALSALAGQVIFHTLFVLGSLPFDVGGPGHGHHTTSAPAVAADPHLAHGGEGMWAAHLAAAALTTVLLHRGELLLAELRALAWQVVRCLLGRVPAPVDGPWASAEPCRACGTAAAHPARRAAGAWTSRGPPRLPTLDLAA